MKASAEKGENLNAESLREPPISENEICVHSALALTLKEVTLDEVDLVLAHLPELLALMQVADLEEEE